MVFEYGLGVLLQMLGTLGLCRLVQIGLKDFFKTNTHFSIAFGLAYLIESTLLGCASLIGILWITSLQIWVLAKVAVGLFVLWQHFHKILCTVRRAWPLFLIFILPTSFLIKIMNIKTMKK